MQIKDKIYRSINVSRDSGVPVLFLSNPGMSKTTCVYEYAKDHGYKVTELRGSTSTSEDITGYYVNEGKETLTIKYPEWFIKLVEDEQPHILFLDEITTVVKNTQAALLKLVFDRQMHDKKLPDSTLIISAGNYNGNLQGGFGMLSPMLNRFCLVNLELTAGDLSSFILTDPSPSVTFDIKHEEITQKNIEKKVANMIDTLVNTYSNTKKGEVPIIDLKNKDYSAVDGVQGEMYGILTGRTVSYLARMLTSCVRLGYDVNMEYLAYGLIGFGTGEVTDTHILRKTYYSDIKVFVNNILKHTASNMNIDISTVNYDIAFNASKNEANKIADMLVQSGSQVSNGQMYATVDSYYKAVNQFITEFGMIIKNIDNLTMDEHTKAVADFCMQKSKEAKIVYSMLEQFSKNDSFKEKDSLSRYSVYLASILEPIYNAKNATKNLFLFDKGQDDKLTHGDLNKHKEALS